MNRIAALAVLAIALGGCATYGPGYTNADGSYAGPYNGGYYSAPAEGYGDYYYDRPQLVYPDYYYGPFYGFGFGYGAWGFGYNPWFYGPCCYHRWWGDGDGDADDWWWRNHHWSGHGTWPHTVSTGHGPHGGMSRGGSSHAPPHAPPRSKHGSVP